MIFTLNARDNVVLELIKEYFKLDEHAIHSEINSAFEYCNSILQKKNINYNELKNTLVPTTDRNEIALVFDSQKIDSAWYGLDIMERVIPLFDKQSSHSVLGGDYIGKDSLKEKLFSEFMSAIIPVESLEKITYKYHSQFFIIYINNLSDKMVTTFNEGLKDFSPYVGYFDLTYSSYIKTYLSTILPHCFIKNKMIILQSHEDDVDNDEDYNTLGYPFEENGYQCKSIQSIYYYMFLSYKIERNVFAGFESDTMFSINAVSKDVLDISEFNLQVEEDKLKYIVTAKEDNLKRAGLIEFTVQELQSFIKDKINNNYIYNLDFLQQYGTIKFNIIVEATAKDTGRKIKLLVALEYKPTSKTLRLITMY